jgi:peptidoglycan/xylan/chitin deacetylase (PgdA/CDA1 family)
MPDSIVLCYHALSPTWEADLSTTPERFRHHITLLLKRGYRCVRFTEAICSPRRGKVLAITFDDAYRSVIEFALPILERLGVPASVFVPTDYIEGAGVMHWPGIDHWLNGPSEGELTPMSWSEIRSLAAAGWEIGSHSGSHPHLTQLNDAELADELGRSKSACEAHVSGTCTSVAYPYGDVDGRVIAATAQAGYATAGALPSRLDARGPLEWPRIGVYRADDDLRFRLKMSPTVRRLRSSGAWDVVGSLRRRNRPGD